MGFAKYVRDVDHSCNDWGILFVADFPRQAKQSEKLKQQNRSLMKKYDVQGFPTVLIMNANGKVLNKTGYRDGGAEAYVTYLKELSQRY